MDNVQRKRSREKLESDEEDIEIVIYLLSFLIGTVGAWYHENYLLKDLSMSDNDERAYRRALWMRCLRKDPTCLKQLRVNARTFNRLCDVLCNEGGLVATKNVTVEEIVALFLHILGHDKKNSTITATFVRSSETVSRQFHTVLRAMLKVGKLLSNNKVMEYFMKEMLRDGSGFRVCDANLKFLYVLPGWEGSASDARVLRDALQRPNGLKVYTVDKYYLVDAGYTNGPGFLAPYRATRYHLNEWKGNTPTNFKELFNLRHSSARNAIERTFGLLKKRWAILRTASFYNVKTQIRIINACCILHNFIRGEMPIDPLLDEVDRELESNLRIEDDDSYNEEQITIVRNTNEWTTFRDDLARQMFEDYQARHAQAN
ncbi:UNVERIFIED_CONTAM: hypothetical protein Scaly_2189000 [Sesamum calycinum]|uniref:DDE Tnp4 domain-containing protein n=1 Tax=Sesamum calycinum TaxID=2727403 RepID=A0AAW2MQ28_9LAMI